jgi:hypothetical protein
LSQQKEMRPLICDPDTLTDVVVRLLGKFRL